MQSHPRTAVIVLFAAFAIQGCASKPLPATERRAQDVALPSLIDLPVVSNIEIKLEDREWWNLGGYEPRVILNTWGGHGWFHGPRCLPPFRVIATLTTPRKHPFIRANDQQQREYELLLASETKPSAVQMDLAPVSLDEMEKEFLEAAFPRLRDNSQWAFKPEPCAWGFLD